MEKIRHGIALSDDDRQPWLERLRAAITDWIVAGHNVVLACSALNSSYRQELEVGPEVRCAYLRGSADLIAGRLRARQGHFAGEQILASQLADLEEPDRAVIVDIAKQHHAKSWGRFGRSSAWRRIFAPPNRSTKRPGTYPCRRIPTHVRLMPFLLLLSSLPTWTELI